MNHNMRIASKKKERTVIYQTVWKGAKCTNPEVVAACCQDGLVGMELLLAGDQGDVAQLTILPLLVEGRENRVLVGL